MDRLRDELRITLRTLAKAPGFAGAVIATLALALALETTMLSLVNAYLVRSLPYPEANRLYQVSYAVPGQRVPARMEELDWASLSDVVEDPIAWDLDMFYLVGGEYPERAPGAWVTPGFMHGLGVQPAIGRAFTAEEFERGGAQTALISHELWQSRFGGDSSVIGRTFNAYVSDRPRDPEVFTIIGVLPAAFWHLNPYTMILTPLRAATYPYLVRLHAGVPSELAERRISNLVRAAHPELPSAWSASVRPVHAEYTKSLKPLLLTIGSAVSLVLIIACSNVMLLVVLRGIRRRKEIVVRLALGASKVQVARLLVAESLVLTTTATALGVLVAMIVNRAFAPMIERQLGRRVPGGVDAVALDGTVIAAVIVLTVVITALMSLVPMMTVSGRAPFAGIGGGARSTTDGPRVAALRALLISFEVAGSFALLVGCGLMVQTVRRMLDVNLGIQPARVVQAVLATREQSYASGDARIALYDRLLPALHEIPGVRVAALTNAPPLVSYAPRPIQVDGATGSGSVTAETRSVSSEYFAAFGIPVRDGRALGRSDRAASEPVAVVSASFARSVWPNTSAIGRRISRFETPAASEDSALVTRTVVGVVDDVRQSPTDSQSVDVYIPLLQAPSRFVTIVVAGDGRGANWSQVLRRAVKEIDPEATLSPAEQLSSIAGAQLTRPRFLASMFSAFGFFASVLGIMGVYGVTAYAAKQREREIAVRMAVGADRRAILMLFLRQGGGLIAAGICGGALAALGIGRLLASELFGVAPVDGVTLVLAAFALGFTCVVAIGWPAWRAGRMDPLVALRSE